MPKVDSAPGFNSTDFHCGFGVTRILTIANCSGYDTKGDSSLLSNIPICHLEG